ncbi:PKD domain-containing protein, partial [Snuella lapsa]|uniref:PKD domain-containing protein n=1 Tax=Snuella lapsa TaxID=870481 RepID=UPI0031E8D8EB
MKTSTYSLLSKTRSQIKNCLYIFVFLFIGLSKVHAADCIIDTAATGGDNVMTGAELVNYINTNGCTGTITIANGVQIQLHTDITIPSVIDRVIIEDGGQIMWFEDVTLTLAPNSAIVIEDTTELDTSHGGDGAISSDGQCNNNRRINIGSFEYSACSGGGNVCIIFSEVIAAGGTIQIDPDFGVIDGTDNQVCFAPTLIDVELNGFVEGTPTYLWTVKSKPIGSTVTFSPSNTVEDPTVTVSEPGSYIFNIAVTIPISDECVSTLITVDADVEIEFIDTISVNIMSVNPGGGGTCNLAVDFTGSGTNAGPNSTYYWDFGDGNNSALQNPSHTYAAGGDYTVTLTITDPDAIADCNTASASDTITITDTPPTITCPPTVNVIADNGLCTALNVDLGDPDVDDDCDISDLTISNDAPSPFPIGTTIVTWTVEDASGNIVTCEQTVTVTDNEIPTITCPDNINQT